MAPRPERGPRAAAADIDVAVPGGGRIKFYISTDQFVAHCPLAELHGRACRLTRTCLPGPRPGQGRPLGLLMSWIQRAGEFGSQDAHVRLQGPPGASVNDLANRTNARAAAMAAPEMDALFEQERGKDEGEADEPERIS